LIQIKINRAGIIEILFEKVSKVNQVGELYDMKSQQEISI
jgi:hypothetical protein